MYSLRQYPIYSRLTNRITIRLRLSLTKKTPLVIAPSASNLLTSYRPLSSTVGITVGGVLVSIDFFSLFSPSSTSIGGI